MIYQLALLFHIIAGMVYFGLPFCFARWFRTCMEHEPARQITVAKLRLFCRLHLNACALVILLTGGYMTGAGWLTWHLAALTLLVLSLANLNLFLLPALKPDTPSALTGRRLTIFAGSHHTLITLIIALMVFRPVW